MKPGLQRLHLHADGHRRRYLVYVPRSSDGTMPLPVVLMFHGAGATGRWAMFETRLDEKAEEAGFLAVFPEGLPPHPGKLADFLHNPLSWNDGSEMWSGHDDLAFIEKLLDELPGRFPIDPRRIYATGFSNGAGFSFLVAERFSQRLAALAPVAGHCWKDGPQPERPVPTLYLIGTADPLLPMEGGTVMTPWGQTATKPPVRQTWDRWAGALGQKGPPELIDQKGVVRLYRYGPGDTGAFLECATIAGHGHHWPGGRGQLEESLAGKRVEEVKANDLIWEFFRQRSLS